MPMHMHISLLNCPYFLSTCIPWYQKALAKYVSIVMHNVDLKQLLGSFNQCIVTVMNNIPINKLQSFN